MNSRFNNKTAPDGTQILHHDASERQTGIPDQDTITFRQAREAAYTELFGEPLSVSHELLPQIPHIDVYTFKRTSKRPEGDQFVYPLVTGGMSDLPMTVPQQAVHSPRRVELVFYCTEPREEYIQTLRWLAHFPHDSKSWLGHGHTMPNGNPPEPLWGSAGLNTVIFMPPIVSKDQTLPNRFQINGDPVHLLWVVPLSAAECNYKLQNGFDAMLDLFDQNQHPHVFDPKRKTYT